MEKNHSKRTQTRDRSEGKLGLYFGKFSIYGEKNFVGVILGNQKLLIPNMLRVTARVARSSRIPGIHEGDSRWRRRETDAEAENTKNTANKLTHTTIR